ncbi:MAG: MOSC N-terminal beta barrel domain-containing protein, partial [Mycobacteriaceae bacterium]
MVATVSSMHRFPVKSMLGEDLQECVIDDKGLVGDRAYAVFDTEDGCVASAKSPRKWASLLSMSARFVAEPLLGEVPPPVEIAFPDGSVLRSDDDGIDDALSATLGRSVRLISERLDEPRYELAPGALDDMAPQAVLDYLANDRAQSPSRLALAGMPAGTFYDLAMLHVLTTSTMDTLHQLAPEADVDVRRFRPNLLLQTSDTGFAEDEWVGRTIAVGETMQFSVSMLTMRCVMTSLAQG